MRYKIICISNESHWIIIGDGESRPLDETAFAAFVRSAAERAQGNISEVGYLQYSISKLPFVLVFRWDDLFGAVVIYSEPDYANRVAAFLLEMMEQGNNFFQSYPPVCMSCGLIVC